MPLVRTDGGIWLGDLSGKLFHLSAAGHAELVPSRDPDDLGRGIVGLGSAKGWTVAAVDAGAGRVGLYELGPSSPVALTAFDLPSGHVHLALLPSRRQVIAASNGLAVVGSDGITILVGGAVLVDVDEGPVAVANVSSVTSVALSADGSLAFVADSGGLKAFVLP